MAYKIETHLHTTYVSKCGWLGAEPILTAYEKAGYSALCVTDHYNRTTFDYLEIDLKSTTDKLDAFLLSYRRLSAAAAKHNIRIYSGAELRFDGSENDYLLYNFDPDMLADPECVISGGLEAFTRRIQGSGALLIQAHPFRDGCHPMPPELLDGVEVYNASTRHDNHNDLAAAFAEEHHLLTTSGSDAHRQEDLARAGILADTLPEDAAGFADLIRSGAYTLITGGNR